MEIDVVLSITRMHNKLAVDQHIDALKADRIRRQTEILTGIVVA